MFFLLIETILLFEILKFIFIILLKDLINNPDHHAQCQFQKSMKAKFMKKFFDDGFMNKAKCKADGDLAMAQAYKIIINSGYGFWGLRIEWQ